MVKTITYSNTLKAGDEMLKLIGALIVVVATTSYGFYRSSLYKKRVEQLKHLIYIFNRLRSDIQFNLTPLPEAFRQLSLTIESPFNTFFKQLYLNLEQDRISSSFEQIWATELEKLQYESELLPQQLDILKQLGAVLGISDSEDQYQHLQHAIERLTIEETIAVEEHGKYASLWRNLGALVGVALVILLI